MRPLATRSSLDAKLIEELRDESAGSESLASQAKRLLHDLE